MTLGKIVKELVCSIKDPIINPTKLFIVKLLDLNLAEKDKYIVAIDNKLGLGTGDIVLLVMGSGSRKLEENTDMPVDCAITAKVENINIDPDYNFLL
ncbi:MAG: EutN/CcmL family microcompartment protein [Actinobacteria bacterium]|nr:EutN/CcmL family microcompartment protein [Actinomycetota bacterium]